MLTGTRAFAGEDVSETMANVLKSSPDWSLLPDGIPQSARRLLIACLQKDAGDRPMTIGVVSYALGLPEEPPVLVRRHGGQMLLAAGISVLSLVLVALSAAALYNRGDTHETVGRFTIQPSGPLPIGSPPFRSIALSPDGSRLTYLLAEGPIGGEVYVRPPLM
jgi:hypothetical protein